VAQRRRRLFAVGVLGDLGGPAEILFEPEGLRWDTPSSREKRQALAADAGSGPAGADGECPTPWDVQSKRVHSENGVAPTLPSGGTEGMTIQHVVMASGHSHAEIGMGGVVPTLTAHNQKDAPVLAAGTTCFQCSAQRTATSSSSTTRVSGADGLFSMADDNAKTAIEREMCGSLKVGGAPPMVASRAAGRTIFEGGYVVRRLTPTECERLQGFPDGWTDLTGCDADAVAEKVAASLHYDEGKSFALLRKVRKWAQECPDGPRYKACGNSMAVPNMRWLFERIQAYDTMRETEVDA
jgi:DNA (cytosine-5)-methyltransferase 1